MKLSIGSFLVLVSIEQYFVLSERYSKYEESHPFKRSVYDLIPWHEGGGAGPAYFRQTGNTGTDWSTAGRNQRKRMIKLLYKRLMKKYVRIV